MVYQFKQAAHIPSGVTVEAVVEERERVVREYGKASVKLATRAVLANPNEYPNLRAFGPADPEQAFEEAIARGIRYAFANVVEVHVSGKSDERPREVRVFHSVPDSDGEMVYESLAVIATVKSQRDHLFAQLNADVDAFTSKLKDVIAEIQRLSA